MYRRLFPKISSFVLLNITQFLGALNDNVFKFLIVYFLIYLKGAVAANTIVSLAGGVFVVPFLLFSAASGVLADKVSKRSVIVVMKFLEIVIMLLGMVGIWLQSEVGLYTFLFLMGAQSAVFAPSKYGIIPELVESRMVSKANASITSLTYLAIILGTFLASFLTKVSSNNYLLVGFICVIIAVLGFIASLGIIKTESQKSTHKIHPFFLYEVYQTLRLSLKRPYLFPAILGSSFFLFIGAYVQLNVIPYAMDCLHLSQEQGGYLFLSTAVGIALGAKLSGFLSKDQIQLGLACFSGFFIVGLFFLLSLFSFSLYLAILFLVLLGVFGGMFLIPLDTFIQVASPGKRKGQIIAASNFLSFTGVFLASLSLYLFNEEWGFSPAGSFAMVGLLTLIFNLTITGRLSEFFFPFLAEKVWVHRYQLEVLSPLPSPPAFLIVRFSSFRDHLLLFYLFKHMKLAYLARPFRMFPWVNGLVSAIRIIPPHMTQKRSLERLFETLKEVPLRQGYILLYIPSHYSKELIQAAYQKVGPSPEERKICYLYMKKERKKAAFLSALRKRKVQLYFSSIS